MGRPCERCGLSGPFSSCLPCYSSRRGRPCSAGFLLLWGSLLFALQGQEPDGAGLRNTKLLFFLGAAAAAVLVRRGLTRKLAATRRMLVATSALGLALLIAALTVQFGGTHSADASVFIGSEISMTLLMLGAVFTFLEALAIRRDRRQRMSADSPGG